MRLRIALGMVVVGMASACGGGGDGGGGAGGGGAAGTPVSVTLDEKNNSGKTGRGELQPGAASTDVTIEINGQSENDVIHVHSGSCEMPGEEIVHDLGFTTASLGQGQIFETLDQVATGEFVIDIHDEATDEVIMCGRIPEQ